MRWLWLLLSAWSLRVLHKDALGSVSFLARQAPAPTDPAYAAWVAAQLPQIPVNANANAALQGLAVATNPGLFLEFGVYTGTSINQIAKQRPQAPVYGFDSFQGLPGDWRNGFPKAAFDLQGKLPAVDTNVHLVPGWFNETLPQFLAEHPEPVSFLHVDCDMYSSSKTVLESLAPRIVPGTVIVFDELVNYPEFLDHEMKSLYEFAATHGRQFQWIGGQCPVVPNGASPLQGYCCAVALRITV
jgi:predicted O-methyltransferase YrrM